MRKLCVLVVAVVALSLQSCQKNEQPADTVTAEIVTLVGTVTVNGSEASIGLQVKVDDVIETGAQSLCRIKVGAKTMLQLKENSTMIYQLGGTEGKLVLEKGWLAGITREKLGNSPQYYIKTPTATAAVRGTSYCLKVESPESTYFCTCNGTIRQHHDELEAQAQDVTAAHHKGYRYITENGNPKVVPAGMEYHADKDIEELAAAIGETIDWTTPD